MKTKHLIFFLILSATSVFGQSPAIRATITSAANAAAMLLKPESFTEPSFSGTENYLVVQIMNDSGRVAWGKIKTEIPGIRIPIVLTIPNSSPSAKWETVQIISIVGFYLKQPTQDIPFTSKWIELKTK
jgi:hypothetical protein